MRKHILDRMTEADRATAVGLTASLKKAKAELRAAKKNYQQSKMEIWAIVIDVIDQSYTSLIKKYLNK